MKSLFVVLDFMLVRYSFSLSELSSKIFYFMILKNIGFDPISICFVKLYEA